MRAEFFQHMADVGANGGVRNTQVPGDVRLRKTLGEASQNLPFAIGKTSQNGSAGSKIIDDCASNGVGDHGTPLPDRPHRLDQGVSRARLCKIGTSPGFQGFDEQVGLPFRQQEQD